MEGKVLQKYNNVASNDEFIKQEIDCHTFVELSSFGKLTQENMQRLVDCTSEMNSMFFCVPASHLYNKDKFSMHDAV